MASCETSNTQFKCMKMKMIDEKYINLVIVYLKHIQFISAIAEILPVSFYISLANVHHINFISLHV